MNNVSYSIRSTAKKEKQKNKASFKTTLLFFDLTTPNSPCGQAGSSRLKGVDCCSRNLA